MFGIVIFFVFSTAGIVFVLGRFSKLPVRSEKKLPWGAIIFITLCGIWLGLIFFSTLSFWLSWLFRYLNWKVFSFGPEKLSALLFLLAGLIYIAQHLWRRYLCSKDKNGRVIEKITEPDNSLLFSLAKAPAGYLLFLTIVAIIFSSWLYLVSFRESNGYLQAGASVFSDLAPHSALVSSFAQGANIPPDYPHFAADGILYHFFFYHLAGQLHAGGLSLAFALNFLSALGLVSFILLLGLFSWRLSSNKKALLLAPFLALNRSSFAFFSHLISLKSSSSLTIPEQLWQQSQFIGNTPREEWGLWTVNVYANQRHFPAALAILLILLLLQTDSIRWRNLSPKNSKEMLYSWGQKEFYLGRDEFKKQQQLMVLFIFFLPYWHGSIFLTALMLLFCLAFFSDNRIYLLAAAAGGLGHAFLQRSLFSPQASISTDIFQFGFIAEDKSWGGILIYLLQLLGIFLPLLLIFFIKDKKYRLWLGIASLPFVFSFFFSLTPDVTVNHKFIMISVILWSTMLADFLLSWPSFTSKKSLHSLLVFLTVLTIFILTVTGLYEIIVFKNLSKIQVSIPLENEMISWIEENTAPDAVFLTAPFAYHSFFLTGRRAWYGHPYYAWSAGHDTFAREKLLNQLTWSDDINEYIDFFKQQSIDAILFDDESRLHPDFPLNEEIIAALFPLAAEFDDEGNSKIYLVNDNIYSAVPLHR